MTKQERAEKAQAHYADIKKRLKRETNISILSTKIYSPNIESKQNSINSKSNFILTAQDTVSYLFSLENNDKIAILNFASYKHPGGYFLGGSPAQEEALCHESNLYPILLAFDSSYYEWNRSRLNRALYLDRALYTPNVIFEREGNRKLVDVITCAAPNYRTAHQYQSVPLSLNNKVMEDRINFMYKVAEDNNVNTLIAGAWGCGVFMQDPKTVATLLVRAARNYNIPNIYFAIPDFNSRNFQSFLEVLQKECLNS